VQIRALEASAPRGVPIGLQQRANWVRITGSPKRAAFSHKCSFDRTEFDGDLTPSNVTHLPPILSGAHVLFRAVLSVHLFSHLSEKGRQYLNQDIQERVTRSVLNGVQFARKYTSLDVETIFAWKAKQKDVPKSERYNIRVLIQGYMDSTASFMRCKSRVLQ
jgi:hypothetical protein